MTTQFFAHDTAIIDQGAVVGEGTRIWHFCHIQSGATIGRFCNLGQNVYVGADVFIGNNVKIQNNVSIYTGAEIEDDVFLGPSCVLTNVSNPRSEINRKGVYQRTRFKRGATVGANATILCGVTLGRYSFIGAGSVVLKDVPDYALVLGNPAQRRGWMSRHGHRLQGVSPGAVARCPESKLRYALDAAGDLKCLDLDEREPMPSALATGEVPASAFKAK